MGTLLVLPMQCVVLCMYMTAQTALSHTFTYLYPPYLYIHILIYGSSLSLPPTFFHLVIFLLIYAFLPLNSLYPFLPFLLLLHLAVFFCFLMFIISILEVPYVFGFVCVCCPCTCNLSTVQYLIASVKVVVCMW